MKRDLKAICALSLAGLLLFSLSGCGGGQKAPSQPTSKKLTVYWGALEDYMAIIQVAGAVLTESISVEAKGYLNEGKTKIKSMWGGEQNANEGVQKAKE